MKIIFLILVTFAVTQARDPDVLPYDHGYGERMIVGGEPWEFADYWVLGGMVVMVAAVIALPRIFDGKLSLKPTDTVWRMNLRRLPSSIPEYGMRRYTVWPTVDALEVAHSSFRSRKAEAKGELAAFKFPTRRISRIQ